MSEEPRKELEVLWTPSQVAKYFGVHPVTVYRWISLKQMFNPDKIARFSNRVRIPRSEVERIVGIKKDKIINQLKAE